MSAALGIKTGYFQILRALFMLLRFGFLRVLSLTGLCPVA